MLRHRIYFLGHFNLVAKHNFSLFLIMPEVNIFLNLNFIINLFLRNRAFSRDYGSLEKGWRGQQNASWLGCCILDVSAF